MFWLSAASSTRSVVFFEFIDVDERDDVVIDDEEDEEEGDNGDVFS